MDTDCSRLGIGSDTSSWTSIDLLKGLEEDGLEVLQLDVTDAESIKAAVESVLSKAGRIDLLVCNAGLPYSLVTAEPTLLISV